MNKTFDSLSELQHRVCVAVAAAAAERVSSIFTSQAPLNGSLLRQAIKIAWDYAEGSRIAPRQLSKAERELSAVIPDVEAEPDKGAMMSAGVAGLYALDAITDTGPLAATRALSAALDAVVEAALDPRAAEKAEIEWRQFILEVARAADPDSLNRQSFTSDKYPLRLD